MKRPLFTFCAIAIVVATLAACESGAAAPTAAEGRHYLTHFYLSRAEGASMAGGLYRTLDETLPNVTYATPSGETGNVTTHVVVGTVSDVQRGKGFRVSKPDDPSGIPTDYDDTRATWWTVHATLKVERAIASQTPAEIRIMLASDGPRGFDQMAAGLKGLGRAVWFLVQRANDPSIAYDRNLYRVVEEAGAMVATINGDDTLSLPLMAEDRRKELLRGSRRLRDLEDKARTPRLYQSSGGENPRRTDPEPG